MERSGLALLLLLEAKRVSKTMSPKVWNFRENRKPVDAVYVGRARSYLGRWGNPIRVGESITDAMIELYEWTEPLPTDGRVTRQMAIEGYKVYVDSLIADGILDIEELRGKHLVCWCKPLPCHADYLLEIANPSSSSQPLLFDEETVSELAKGGIHEAKMVH